MAPATLIIADDHPLFRAALREAVGRLLPGAQVVEAGSLADLQSAVHAHPEADLILLDLRMPGARGFSSLVYLRAEYPAIPVAVVSAAEEPAVMQRALDFGASGFIPKSASIEIMGEALRAVLSGAVFLPPGSADLATENEAEERVLARKVATLTPQQLRVLLMLADGQPNKEIGQTLTISEATIKAHVTAILRKLGLDRRTQAAVLAQRLMQSEFASIAPAMHDNDLE